jgi:hypothetical protein
MPPVVRASSFNWSSFLISFGLGPEPSVTTNTGNTLFDPAGGPFNNFIKRKIKINSKKCL